MLADLKRLIARKLCPEVFVDAERWYRARLCLDDLDQWCSVDAPWVGQAARWVLKSVRVHFMPLDEFYAMTPEQHASERVGGISEFREALRRANGLDPIRGRNATPDAGSGVSALSGAGVTEGEE